MGRTRKVGISGKLGQRYGSTIRKRVRQLLERQKLRPYKCPSCFAGSSKRSYVKRKSVGIWTCRKCGHTWAGGSWEPQTAKAKQAQRFVTRLREQT